MILKKLKELQQIFSAYDIVMVEVEDFDAIEEQEAANLAKRRHAFYLRNGYLDTGIKAVLWGIQYRILVYDIEKARPQKEIREAYEHLYRSMMPYDMYLEKVQMIE